MWPTADLLIAGKIRTGVDRRPELDGIGDRERTERAGALKEAGPDRCGWVRSPLTIPRIARKLFHTRIPLRSSSSSVSAMPDSSSIAHSIAWMSDWRAANSPREAIRDLIVAAKKGDAAAFGGLVELFQQRVFRTANALLGSDSDAMDAVQEVFLRAYRSLARFDDSRDLAPWLYKITANVCRDIIKAKRRQYGLPAEEKQLVSTSPGPFETFARNEQRRLTRLALSRLPYKERAAIALRDLEGLPTREVARILGTSEATVRSQVSSGRAKLRRSILGDERRRP